MTLEVLPPDRDEVTVRIRATGACHPGAWPSGTYIAARDRCLAVDTRDAAAE